MDCKEHAWSSGWVACCGSGAATTLHLGARWGLQAGLWVNLLLEALLPGTPSSLGCGIAVLGANSSRTDGLPSRLTLISLMLWPLDISVVTKRSLGSF